jgi:hypothetical protein
LRTGEDQSAKNLSRIDVINVDIHFLTKAGKKALE